MLPLAGGSARFQPVYVGDVADAFAESLTNRASFGQIYELCGPKVYTLRELVEYTGKLIGRRRPIVDLPNGPANLLARIMGLLPNPPMSPDNLRSMEKDNVTDGLRNYPGWQPRSLEAAAPGYLSAVRPKMRYDNYRCRAGR